MIENLKMKPGWSADSQVVAVKQPISAPLLTCEYTNVHKQVKIKKEKGIHKLVHIRYARKVRKMGQV